MRKHAEYRSKKTGNPEEKEATKAAQRAMEHRFTYSSSSFNKRKKKVWE